MKCLEKHLGSAINFKSEFRIQKSDIKTKKIVVRLLGTLIKNALIPPIPLYICASRSF